MESKIKFVLVSKNKGACCKMMNSVDNNINVMSIKTMTRKQKKRLIMYELLN